MSASSLEEVFGQAQKNFAFLELTEERIDYRKTRWLSNYNIGNVATQIKRIRKSSPGKDQISVIKKHVNDASSNGNLRRRIYIVVNYISKKDLIASINLIKKGDEFAHKGVTLQILWFVNSIMANAQDLNSEFRIICRP